MARVKNYKVGAGRDPDIIRSRPTLKPAFIRAYAAVNAPEDKARFRLFSGSKPRKLRETPGTQDRTRNAHSCARVAAGLQPSSRQGRLAGRVCLSGAGAD